MARSKSFLDIKFDNKELRKLKKELNKIKTYHNEWGWINKAKYTALDHNGRKGTYVAEIAFRNEYGDVVAGSNGNPIMIPARPYFFHSINDAVKLNEIMLPHVFTALLHNQQWLPLLNDVAKESRNTLLTEIEKQNMTPLAPKTTTVKGNSYQWEDTGVMLGSITYKTTKAKIKDM